MRAIAILIAALMLAGGCSHQLPPAWQRASYSNLENFRESYLTGADGAAQLYFSRAVEQIKLSGDVKTLCKAYLVRAAVQLAALDEPDVTLAREALAADPDDENRAYLGLFSGESFDSKALPDSYSGFLKVMASGTVEKIDDELRDIQKPLSRIIAASLVVKRGKYDAQTLQIAADTASAQGWIRANRVYSQKLADWYSHNGQPEKAAQIIKRLEFLAAPQTK